MTAQHTTHKRVLFDGLKALVEADEAQRLKLIEQLFAPNAELRASHPINEHKGRAALEDAFYGPLKEAMPDLERRDFICVAGHYNGVDLVGFCGHYVGTFANPWLGIRPTGKTVTLRYGEVYAVENGQITQANVLVDVLDLIRQSGYWPLPPSMGEEIQWQPPFTLDGLRLNDTDEAQGAQSMAYMRAMQETLGEYDDLSGQGRQGLIDMPQREYWHDKVMWYGPSGIGSTRGLAGFVDGHQLPFRIAFPNRNGGNHYVRIGDGPYSLTGGWPSVYGDHLGGGWLGTSPTGRTIKMRVMDFYLEHEGKLRENWVPIDMLHVLLQMDIDILARMQLQRPI